MKLHTRVTTYLLHPGPGLQRCALWPIEVCSTGRSAISTSFCRKLFGAKMSYSTSPTHTGCKASHHHERNRAQSANLEISLKNTSSYFCTCRWTYTSRRRSSTCSCSKMSGACCTQCTDCELVNFLFLKLVTSFFSTNEPVRCYRWCTE